MRATRTDSFDGRTAILRSLVTRNRVVAALRIMVPIAGVAAFAALVGQIYLANLLRDYGVSGIRIDRGSFVVETPRYSGTGSDGARYVVSAREARTPIDHPEEITMTDATLDYVAGGGMKLFASVGSATMNTTTQIVRIPGVADITGDDGLQATLVNVTADMAAGTTRADGQVDIRLSDGTAINASAMEYDGAASRWTFRSATVVMQDLPEVEVQ